VGCLRRLDADLPRPDLVRGAQCDAVLAFLALPRSSAKEIAHLALQLALARQAMRLAQDRDRKGLLLRCESWSKGFDDALGLAICPFGPPHFVRSRSHVQVNSVARKL
jgi:hypothetical protein